MVTVWSIYKVLNFNSFQFINCNGRTEIKSSSSQSSVALHSPAVNTGCGCGGGRLGLLEAQGWESTSSEGEEGGVCGYRTYPTVEAVDFGFGFRRCIQQHQYWQAELSIIAC